MNVGSVLRDYKNLSLMWNVDGVPLFKSSKYSSWPMYLLINELPYKQRSLKKNDILAGLWFGEEKSNMTGAENMGGGRGDNCPSTLQGGGAVPPPTFYILFL